MDSPGVIRDHCFAVGQHRQPGVQTRIKELGAAGGVLRHLGSSRLWRATQAGFGLTVPLAVCTLARPPPPT